jgi:hypothetical protein
MKKKLYIGCALTNITDAERDILLKNISGLKNKLKDHFEIMEFLWVRSDPATATPEEVYRVDIKECVMEADCMLAICDYASLGLGYEMGTAVEKCEIPLLAVAHKDSKVSKLIRGHNRKDVNFYYYDSFDEIFEKTVKLLS